MDLKIKDVAELLNVSVTTIRRWLAEGKIPAYRLHHQYRFNRAEIENWVLSHKLNGSQTTHHHEGEKSLSDQTKVAPSRGGIKQFSLYRAIHKGGILHDVPGATKEEVIANTMKMIAKQLHLDAEVLTELLLERENLQPTALDNGIGIPHTRDFLLNAHQDVVVVAFPKKPIPYGALDGKPVHTLFFLFASDDRRHLHLLAKIAHFSNNLSTADFLQSAPKQEALLDYIKNWEGAIHHVKDESRELCEADL